MDTLVSVLGVPLIFVFTILNLVIYHKIFTVYYFNLQKGFCSEIIGALVLAIFETALVLKIGIYVLIIGAVIVGILFVIGMFSNEQDDTDDGDITEPNDSNYSSDEKENSVYAEESDTTVCPHCGEEINNSAVFCNYCGEEIKKYVQKQSVMSCPNCGKEFEEGRFCPDCGTRVDKEIERDNLINFEQSKRS